MEVKLLIFICILAINIRANISQDDLDLEALIANTFNAGGGTTSTRATPQEETATYSNSLGEGDIVDEDCQCVPYYQCSTNRTVIENGEGLIDIRMKSGLCENYLDVCCMVDSTLGPGESITPSPPPTHNPTSSSCGQRNFRGISSLRITGTLDNEAQFGEFPWMVAVTRKEVLKGAEGEDTTSTINVYQCGGSLLGPSVVLTAAHCVQGKTGLNVRAGEWDTQTQKEPLPTQTRRVRDVIVHENFYAGGLHNDVALLLLEEPLELVPNVGTICLPAQGESMDGRGCVASGWGKDVFGKEGKYQVILKKVELPIVAKDKCLEALRETKLGKNFKLHESFICAGGIPGKDTCKGDGGSPLACPSVTDPQVYVQAGIVAWGIGCGTETPGVYVNVPHFRNWIDSKLSTANIDPSKDRI